MQTPSFYQPFKSHVGSRRKVSGDWLQCSQLRSNQATYKKRFEHINNVILMNIQFASFFFFKIILISWRLSIYFFSFQELKMFIFKKFSYSFHSISAFSRFSPISTCVAWWFLAIGWFFSLWTTSQWSVMCTDDRLYGSFKMEERKQSMW